MSVELEAQLVAVQDELDELRVEYNNFTYAVSHDLAAPFRQIEGFASIILAKHGDQFDEKSSRHLELIMKGAASGAGMVESLLEYSRICSATTHVSTVNCNTTVADVLTELSPLIQNNNAQYSCGQMPVIEGDASLLSRLFYHVIHNALLYHKPGSRPAIAIESAEDETQWTFTISDNGIGIPEKRMDKVFVALKRAVAPKDYPGQGMGLTIAKCVVKKHHGNISIQNNENGGCAVHMSFLKSADRTS